jgi:N6-adenosine-specific RNA methylase IME4
MSKQTDAKRFTRIVSELLVGVHDLVNWGIDTANTTSEELKMLVLRRDPRLRREAAIKLIESGLSQRKTAKVLGVHLKTVQRDLAHNASESDAISVTGSTKTIAHRTQIASAAIASGVTINPSDKYRIIYADPPWSYGNTQPDYHTEQRDHYPVMELPDICALPVSDWIEDDAVLFLWATSPILEECFQVIRAWGFNYKASFVWDKIKHNMGHYNSVRHELLLICTRGSCQPDTRQLFDSVQNIERGEHSEKPVEFYDIIETLYTRGRRLEIFARDRRKGWDQYGHISEIMSVAAE